MLLQELQRQQEHGRRMMAALSDVERRQAGSSGAPARYWGSTSHPRHGGVPGGGATSGAQVASPQRRPASIARRGGRDLLIGRGAGAGGGGGGATAVMSPVRAKTSHGGAPDRAAQRRTQPRLHAPHPQPRSPQPQPQRGHQRPQQRSAKEGGGGGGPALAASASLPSVDRGGTEGGLPLSPHPWTGEALDRAGSPTAMDQEGVAGSPSAQHAARSRLRWKPRKAPARDSPAQSRLRGKAQGLPAL